MRRVSTLASSAAPIPTSTAIAEMTTTRRSTGTYSGGASTAASAGSSDGATGKPLAAFNGVCDSSGTPDASSRLVLEHHRWRRQVDPAGKYPQLEQLRQRGPLIGTHPRHAVYEITLHGWRRAAEQALASGRQRNVHATAIGRRGDTRHESTVDQPADDDRDGALMCRRSFRELIQRFRGLVDQLLKDKELREADAQLSLDTAGVQTQRAHDATNGVHRAGGVVGRSHGYRCIGCQCIEASDAAGSEARVRSPKTEGSWR